MPKGDDIQTTPAAAPDVVELSLQPGAVNYVTPLDAAAAEITRLSEEARDFHHAAGVANIAADALRARVAELEASIRHITVLLDDVEEESNAVSAIAQHCYGSLIATGVTPTPVPRDARIAELETALRAAQRGFADIGNSDRVDEIEDVLSPGWRERWQMDLSRALGDGHG